MSDYKSLVTAAEGMQGYVVAALTDEYIVDRWPMSEDLSEKEEKILEVRVFNEEKEIKLFRTDIGKKFKDLRILDDSELYGKFESFEQEQYLDIDTKRSVCDDGYVFTTGGGNYRLPFGYSEESKVIIKYYMEEEPDSGMARIADWRVAGFTGIKEA